MYTMSAYKLKPVSLFIVSGCVHRMLHEPPALVLSYVHARDGVCVCVCVCVCDMCTSVCIPDIVCMYFWYLFICAVKVGDDDVTYMYSPPNYLCVTQTHACSVVQT